MLIFVKKLDGFPPIIVIHPIAPEKCSPYGFYTKFSTDNGRAFWITLQRIFSKEKVEKKLKKVDYG